MLNMRQYLCPCRKEGKWYSGLQRAKYCQQVEGGDRSPLLSAGEATPEVLHLLGFPVQERYEHTGGGSMRVHRDD